MCNYCCFSYCSYKPCLLFISFAVCCGTYWVSQRKKGKGDVKRYYLLGRDSDSWLMHDLHCLWIYNHLVCGYWWSKIMLSALNTSLSFFLWWWAINIPKMTVWNWNQLKFYDGWFSLSLDDIVLYSFAALGTSLPECVVLRQFEIFCKVTPPYCPCILLFTYGKRTNESKEYGYFCV